MISEGRLKFIFITMTSGMKIDQVITIFCLKALERGIRSALSKINHEERCTAVARAYNQQDCHWYKKLWTLIKYPTIINQTNYNRQYVNESMSEETRNWLCLSITHYK